MSDEKPPLADSLRRLAERERRSLTGHPTPAELGAYHAGELSPEAESRVREHLALCRECSDLLLDLAGFADLTPPPGIPELTDEEVEQDWQSLRSRLGEEEETEERRPAEVVPIRPAAPVRRERTRSHWLAIAASLLAVLASFGLYQSWRKPSFIEGTEGLKKQTIEPHRRMRGREPSLSSERGGVLRLFPIATAERYDAEIARGREVLWSDTIEGPREEIFVKIPDGYLEPGSYAIRVYASDGTRRKLFDSSFEVDE